MSVRASISNVGLSLSNGFRRFWRFLGVFFRPLSRRTSLFRKRIVFRYDRLALQYPFLHTLWFRGISAVVILSLIISPLYVVLDYVLKDISYQLSDKETALLGVSTVGAEFIKQTADTITYNRQEEADGNEDLQKVLAIAANKEDATGEKPYQAELSKDPKKGIMFSDSEGARSISLTPTFHTGQARLEDERVIYPAGTAEKHIYSFKNNGIKSDILLTRKPSDDTKTYSWDLGLDSTLEARMLPDGGVGIYSADPTLYGNLQISDQKSQELIDKARTNAAKNSLVFELPKPFILDANNETNYEDVVYELEGKTLTLKAKNLKNQAYPLTIDPTVTVTTTSDFQQKTGDTGNTEYGTDGEIRRAIADNGAVGATTQLNSAFTAARYGHASVAYNGYLYIVGGFDGTTNHNDIHYCQINTDGSVDVCSRQTSMFTTGRTDLASAVHNGYLYVIGGGASGSYLNDIQSCQINSDGTVQACTSAGTFTTGRIELAATSYNGYIYITGGTATGGAYQNDIQRCPLNANGTTGTCVQQTNAFPTPRYAHSSVAYNGYLYVIGGLDEVEAPIGDIQYCPINSDGTVGTCVEQTSIFTGARYSHASVAYNGYIYISGGFNGVDYQNDIQYCPINSNGSVATCTQQTAAFTTIREGHTSVAYNGYLYIIGGVGVGYKDDIQHLEIGPPAPLANQQTSAFSIARSQHSSVVYNGYLYIVGGFDGGAAMNDLYYCPINANGPVGTCTRQAAAFTTARFGHTSVVHGGYLYIIGGWTGSVAQNDVQYCAIDPGTHAVGACTQQAAAFTTARAHHTSVVYRGYLYIIGGWNFSTSYNDIQYCFFNTNGSIGTCTQKSSAFQTPRREHSSVVYDGYLYIVGGTNGTEQNDIQYCPLNIDGPVGTCVQQATIFTSPRSGHSSVVLDGYLYIIGGYDGTRYNDIQYCQINTGSHAIVSCDQKTNAFTTARNSHTSAIYGGYLYIIGGHIGTDVQNDIQYTQIGSGSGGVGTVTRQTAAFTTARNLHAAAVSDGYLYIVGGYSGSARLNDIRYCQFNADGSVGACSLAGTFTSIRNSHTAVIYDGYLYLAGGYDGTNHFNDIQYCQIKSDHTVDTCVQKTNAFKFPRYGHTSFVHNGYLYIVGGTYQASDYYNDIYYCKIKSDHSVDTCIQQPTAFIDARTEHASFVYDDYLYIVGGMAFGGSYRNDIQYCPLNTNGTIGTCIRQNGAFAIARANFAVTSYNGYIYIFGGYNAGVSPYYFDDIQTCRISADHSVDACGRQTSAITVGRQGLAVVAHKGNLYAMGGLDNASTRYDDIQRFPLRTIYNKARYERVIDTGLGGNILGSFTINGTTPERCRYALSYKTAGSDGVFGSETTVDNVESGASQALNATSKRYLFLSITSDDANCSSQSSITDISLVYNSSPDAPTLIAPANSATDINTLPEFRLGSTDDSNDYLRYKIEVCSTSNCDTIVRTIDQTSSQTGWQAQSVQSGTAYTGGLPLTQLAIHKYQPTALTANTQYWWRAQALDPGGTNQWSSYSTIYSFTTTTSATPNQIDVGGNVTIYGGTDITTDP